MIDNIIVCLINAIVAKWSFDYEDMFWGWVNLVLSALNFAWFLVKYTA